MGINDESIDNLTYDSMIEDSDYNSTTGQSEISDKSLHAKNHEKYLLFMLGGLLSLAPTFICFASADVFNEVFQGMNYNFYCVLPTYACIPLVILLTKILDAMNWSMNSKLTFSLIGIAGGMISIGVLTFIVEPTQTNFWLIMLLFLMVFTFGNLYQSFMVSIASIYEIEYVSVYFKYQPVANIIINVIKFSIDFFKVSQKTDFMLVYGFCVILILLTGWRFITIVKCQNYRDSFLNEESQNASINYSEGWGAVKGEAIGLFFTMFLSFLAFPGVYFSSRPTTLFSFPNFILLLNGTGAIFDWFGRFFSMKSYTKSWVYSSFLIVALFDVFVYFIYFKGLNFESEGITLLFIPMIAFTLFRTAFSISYFMIESSKKSNSSNRNAVGSIMSNILVFGIAIGNMSSLFINTFKK